MYVDKEIMLCSGQDVYSAQTDVYSDYAINLGANTDIGKGNPVTLVINVTTEFEGSGSLITFAVVDEEDATLAGTSIVLVQTKPIAITALTEGTLFALHIPAGLMTQQYLGLKVTTSTANSTAGAIDAFVALDAQTN